MVDIEYEYKRGIFFYYSVNIKNKIKLLNYHIYKINVIFTSHENDLIL